MMSFPTLLLVLLLSISLSFFCNVAATSRNISTSHLREKRSAPQKPGSRSVLDLNGHPLNLQTNTWYTFVNKRTGYVHETSETLNIFEKRHWFRIFPHQSLGGTNAYHIRYYGANGILYHKTVCFSKSTGQSYFIHPNTCGSSSNVLFYFSSRDDARFGLSHGLKGTYCGTLNNNHGPGYAGFEYRAIPFSDYIQQFYDINGAMFDFQFKALGPDVLKNHNKKVSLIEQHLVTNCLEGTVSKETTVRSMHSDSATLSVSKSVQKSARNFNSFQISVGFKPSFYIFGIGASGPEFQFNTDWGYESTTTQTSGKELTSSSERTISYEASSVFELRAHTCAILNGYTDMVDNLEMEYKASIRIRLTDKDDAVLDKVKGSFILERLGFSETPSKFLADGTMIFKTQGVMKSSFGIKSVITALPAKDEDCPCASFQ